MNIDQFTERVIIVCTIFIWHLIVIHRFQSLANLLTWWPKTITKRYSIMTADSGHSVVLQDKVFGGFSHLALLPG